MDNSVRLIIVMCHLQKMNLLEYLLDGKLAKDSGGFLCYKIGPHIITDDLVNQIRHDPDSLLDFYQVDKFD
jgi:hypothetical protein